MDGLVIGSVGTEGQGGEKEMLSVEKELEYKTFDGFSLEKQKTVWRYSCSSEVPINTFVRIKNGKNCHCGSKLVLLAYQYVASCKQSQKMHGRKCPVCGNNYFTMKTISLYPEAYRVENENGAALVQDKSESEIIDVEQHQADKTYIEDRIDFLFIDMEWNQKAGTKDLEGREPIQIGLLGADECLEETKLFSKGIRLEDVDTLTEETCKITHAGVDTIMRANSLEEVFKRVKMSFPKFKYAVVWTKDTYDLFVQSAKQAGIKLPKHRVLVLQDIIGLIATSGKKKIGFETVLTKAEIQYNPAYLHFSKRDVQYLFALYKKMYTDYQELAIYESGVVNEKTRVIHTSECRYAKHINESAHRGVKALVFKGFRACNCCGSELNLRKIYWIPTLQEEKSKKVGEEISEAELRNLPLTESNIKQICNRYSIKCNISEHILFLTTNCGYWRLYIDGEKVNKVLHGNYKMKQCDHKKKKKCNEGFHQQKIAYTNFYDVVRYIYHHDKNLYVNCKKSKVEILLEKIAQERKMNEGIVYN